MRRAVGGGRDAVRVGEAGREGTDALEADREAHVRDRAVRAAQQRRRALEAAGEQVLVRRLAEGTPELAAEVGAREAGGAGEVVDAERLEVARVGQVPGSQEVPGGWDEWHSSSIADPVWRVGDRPAGGLAARKSRPGRR